MSESSRGLDMSTFASKMSVFFLLISLPSLKSFRFPKEIASAVVDLPDDVEAQTQLVVLRDSNQAKGRLFITEL